MTTTSAQRSSAAGKITVPEQHWDAMFAPSSMLSIITTVDEAGRVNAAASGTCTRVCHDPMHVSFTIDAEPMSDTGSNVLATGEFVVNGVPFAQEMLRATRLVGLPYRSDVDELEKAGLTAIPVSGLRPPIIAESRIHLACTVSWTRPFEHRLMVCGRVTAVLINEDCYDPRGLVRWEALRPAHYFGAPYGGSFVAIDRPTYVARGSSGDGPWRPDATIAADLDVLGDPNIQVEFGGEANRRKPNPS